jgi:para-nitrobenzyl esterase
LWRRRDRASSGRPDVGGRLAFARTGDPGWPAYDATRRATMVFDLESRVVDDPAPEVRKALQG